MKLNRHSALVQIAERCRHSVFIQTAERWLFFSLSSNVLNPAKSLLMYVFRKKLS